MNDSPLAPRPLAVRSFGAGAPLLLFHGGMGSWNHWTRNLDALAGRFRVHAVDLPGFGDSYPVPKSMGQTDYVDHVLQGIGPIVGTQPFRLAAFSFGAVVAATTAARLGEQVSRLSLLGAGGFGHVEKLAMRPIPDESAGDAVRREALRFNLCALMLADPASVTEESLTYYADNFRTTRYDGRHFSMSRSVIEALDQIRCPLQFIFGDRDALAGADLPRREEIVRAQRPDAQFVVLADAGHWVQYEAAERVNALLLEFFST